MNARFVSLADYEQRAAQSLNPAVWDYIQGGSDDEVTLRANREAFARLTLHPRVLAPGGDRCDLTTSALGAPLALPIMIAPTALHKLVHDEGEHATARAAAAAGTLFVVSTMSTVSVEEVSKAGGSTWFQLYVFRNRELTTQLVRRAEAAGCRALVVTVDTPRLGRRERDLRNEFALPADIRPAHVPFGTTDSHDSLAEHALEHFEDALSWKTIEWLRSLTELPLVLKGILTKEDAQRASAVGVRGIIVSNHGGRQLDTTPATIDALPEVVAGAGDCEVFLDGGVRRGIDILKAGALGARAVLIGRPALWGLAVNGAAGVRGVIEHLREELEVSMTLSGQSRWSALDRTIVRRVEMLDTVPTKHAALVSVGTANPPRKYTQEELLSLYGVQEPKLTGFFRNSHIRSRHLCLPRPLGPGQMPEESPADLRDKHLSQSLAVGSQAIRNALSAVGLEPEDVDYLLCVTSTGFLCPGLTAHFIKSMGFRPDIHRLDVVGMGCNAGLNGLQPVVNFCARNPGSVGLLLCVEICSAIYVFDMTVRTAIANSLFGDGAAAAVITTRATRAPSPKLDVLGFSSHIITEQIDAMRFDLEGVKNSFVLEPEVPYVIGANVEIPVDRLIKRFGLKRRDITHWVIHSGGRKVIDAIRCALDLSAHDVRNTEAILQENGNLSSASFLFSHGRLLNEGRVNPGDYTMMITMGPGSTIETCLGRFRGGNDE